MKNSIYLFVLTLFVLMTNCVPTINLETERKNLLLADKEWSEASNRNDMERLWSFWTDDAKILQSTDLTIIGIDQIKQFTSQARTDPNFAISWVAQGVHISASGKMGYTYGIGKVTRTGENGELLTITNPYLIVWEKQSDGNWKCVIEN